MTIDRLALKDEIMNDPSGVGYGTFLTPGGNSSVH